MNVIHVFCSDSLWLVTREKIFDFSKWVGIKTVSVNSDTWGSRWKVGGGLLMRETNLHEVKKTKTKRVKIQDLLDMELILQGEASRRIFLKKLRVGSQFVEKKYKDIKNSI